MNPSDAVREAEALIMKVRDKVKDPTPPPLPEIHLGEEKVVLLPNGRRALGRAKEIHDTINEDGNPQRVVAFELIRLLP